MGPFAITAEQLFARIGHADSPLVYDVCRCEDYDWQPRLVLRDPVLDRVAAIVRGADTARMDLSPEAAGLLAISLGNSRLAGADDHQALARGMAVYDALYAWARFAAGETHNWPAGKV